MDEQTDAYFGIELASAPLPSCGHLLVAFAGATADGDPLVELGTWPVRDSRPVRPKSPLLLSPEGLTMARELMEQAARALPHATYDDEDGSTVFGSVDTLLLMAVRGSPIGGTLLSLSAKSSGTAWVPLEEMGAFASVLEEAERALRDCYKPATPPERMN